MKLKSIVYTGLLTALSTAHAWAADVQTGHPLPGQLGMQPAVTAIGVQAQHMHNDLLMPIITGITVFVLILLAYVVFRFRESANPVPSKTTHNTFIELVWTIVPVAILVVIAVPSFKLLYAEARIPGKADLTIKATGHQWYWQYDYIDQKVGFDANLQAEKDLKDKSMYLLESDNHLVVPAGKIIKIITTSADVIHAWMIPSFYVQMDAVPGRLNETWFKVDKPGTYYGQCNQICGINHGYMPVAVDVLTPEKYAAWLAMAKTKFALNDNGTPGAGQMALADTATKTNLR